MVTPLTFSTVRMVPRPSMPPSTQTSISVSNYGSGTSRSAAAKQNSRNGWAT